MQSSIVMIGGRYVKMSVGFNVNGGCVPGALEPPPDGAELDEPVDGVLGGGAVVGLPATPGWPGALPTLPTPGCPGALPRLVEGVALPAQAATTVASTIAPAVARTRLRIAGRWPSAAAGSGDRAFMADLEWARWVRCRRE